MEQGHPIAKFQTVKGSTVEEKYVVVMCTADIAALISRAAEIRGYMGQLSQMVGGKSPGDTSVGGATQAMQHRWILYEHGRVIEECPHWCFGEAAVHAAGAQAKAARSGSDRNVIVQVWMRRVDAPTTGQMHEQACMYMLMAGGRTLLVEDCDRCAAEADDDDGREAFDHSCGWPTDIGAIERVLAEVSIPSDLLSDMVARAIAALGHRLNPSIPQPHEAVVASAKASLMRGELITPEVETLLDNLEYIEGVNEEPDYFNMV